MTKTRPCWRWIGVVAALALCPEEAEAQKTTFDPSISFRYYGVEDVDLTGTARNSDAALRVGLTLPVERQFRKGLLLFSYLPQIEQFSEFVVLDNSSHRMSLDLKLQPTRESSFGVRMSYAKTQEQGDAGSSDDADLFLTSRTDRELARIDLNYRNRLRGRWDWSSSLDFSTARFKEIAGFDTGGPAVDVEDRTGAGGSFGISRRISKTTAIGARYNHRTQELDVSGNEATDRASLTLTRELSRRSSLQFSIGAFRSTGTAALGGGGDQGDSRKGAQGRLNFSHSLEKVELRLFASGGPASGGARVGTSDNSQVGFSVRSKGRKRFGWQGALRYARRDASDPDVEDVQSVNIGLAGELKLTRLIGLRLNANYIDQTGKDDRLNVSLLSEGGLSLIWYPLAGTRLSGRSQRP